MRNEMVDKIVWKLVQKIQCPRQQSCETTPEALASAQTPMRKNSQMHKCKSVLKIQILNKCTNARSVVVLVQLARHSQACILPSFVVLSLVVGVVHSILFELFFFCSLYFVCCSVQVHGLLQQRLRVRQTTTPLVSRMRCHQRGVRVSAHQRHCLSNPCSAAC